MCGTIDNKPVCVPASIFAATFKDWKPGDVIGNAGLSSWCPAGIPLYSGIVMDVPLGSLLPSIYYVRFRTWNSDGHSQESNTVLVRVQ